MDIIRLSSVMRETSAAHLARGRTIGFVPTMGALHKGHLSLIRRAKQDNSVVVASIFVNPAQFGPHEDFESYPRDQAGDMDKLIEEGVDILFAPEVPGIYPTGFATRITVGGLSDRLCGAFRPGHFTGVATIVCKLFNIVAPTRSYFGQKDFQQTAVIRRMVADLSIPAEMVICPTIREPDGLAMSSRNAYLDPLERQAAAQIYATLCSTAELISPGSLTAAEVQSHMRRQLKREPLITEIQYAGVFSTTTLEELAAFEKENLLAVAVMIGRTRLIDNVVVQM